MGLLKPASNQTAHLKLGMLGFEGSGKTYTAVDFAIGMAKLTKKMKVAFYDTEKGSDFHIDRFKKEGIQFDVTKSRSFKDLCDVIREAEAGGYSFLIIDSITHVWRDLVESFMKKNNRSKLRMNDWGILKTEWRQYTDLYVNSKLSIAMLGRAGHEYDMSEDDEGNQEIQKAGTKMKVETETGFEPDLLIEMFKSPRVTVTKTKKGTTKTKKERGFVNKCIVLKERNAIMNGVEIENPTFKHFLPVINKLNIGGEHLGVDTSRTSEEIFKNPDYSYVEKDRRRAIALESLQDTFVLIGMDGRSSENQKKRIETLKELFGVSEKTAIENLPLEKLEVGVKVLKQKYNLIPADPPANNGVDTSEQLPF